MHTNQDIKKYMNPVGVDLPDRTWPTRRIEQSPAWCSVDLRDGNQALPNPLDPEQKLEYFQLLCEVGFKEIEVAFPSASRDDFEFTRRLIEERHVPEDVRIMVLTQCRAGQIDRTIEAIQDAPRAIVHAYCAASRLHREQVYGMSTDEVLHMVTDAVERIRDGVAGMPDVRFEFSPEEFTDAEPDFALELCVAAVETWGRATSATPVILNLPASVERRPPNQYADQIEWFCRRFPNRANVTISLHPHNDQGMAVAAAELAQMAGADRVEGALFGHGERTGNVDIVTLAMNLQARGIESGLDFSRLPEIAATVERLTGIPVHCRQPYSGEYVFTAFSGSHQDAIRKGMQCLDDAPEKFGVGWKVPYLHIDPADVGRRYQSLIRINTQSGKGGAAWVLEQGHGLKPPRRMHLAIGAAVQAFSDEVGREVTADEVGDVFESSFIQPPGPYALIGYWPRPDDADPTQVHGEVRLRINDREVEARADGNGPLSAFVQALRKVGIDGFRVEDYHEQAVGNGSAAQAVAYVTLRLENGEEAFGAGRDTNIDQAAVRAVVAALNRAVPDVE